MKNILFIAATTMLIMACSQPEAEITADVEEEGEAVMDTISSIDETLSIKICHSVFLLELVLSHCLV